MEILFVLLPLSLVLILVALRVFSWAIRSGQFEDLDRESLRILMDNRGDADTHATRSPTRESARRRAADCAHTRTPAQPASTERPAERPAQSRPEDLRR